VRLLAIDPGRDKCGLAVLDERGVVARGVVPTATIGQVAYRWSREHDVSEVVLGDGTGYRRVRRDLHGIDLPIAVVPERGTTWRARRRYFAEHRPRGWRRLLPLGLQAPPVPIDDYAAVLIAEDYLAGAAQKGEG
jgi:RNase H-fold protein (predicted Holliday junction resolvase)